MFNPFLPPQLAFATAPAAPLRRRSERSDALSTRVLAMLPGQLRGRGIGRGAPPHPAHAPSSTNTPHDSHAPHTETTLAPEVLEYLEAMGQNLLHLRDELSETRSELAALTHRDSDSKRVFDALHAELGDYKRDFIYEHMKPLLRPLLFLFDSLQGFDEEMALYEVAQTDQTLAPDALKATKVRQNITFLRDQLIEALQVCDVEPMPIPHGAFDAKTQKAVDTLEVAPELEGQIQKVVRTGWTMHGQPFRPTEVVIGRSHS